MAVRPKVGTDISDKYRGSGALAPSYSYLMADPASYYYEKFKREGNQYLDDEMWTEAAKRGETASLINLLTKRDELDAKQSEVSSDINIPEEQKQEQISATDTGIDYLQKWKDYDYVKDYDGYMLALSIPTLDNTTKKERKDNETGYVFGNYTDREWAEAILNDTFARYDAELVEDAKSTQNFFVGLGAAIGSAGSRLLAGVGNFLQNVYNVGEGLLNILINWSNDENIGNRFIAAFDDENESFAGNPFGVGANAFEDLAYHLERDFTVFVDAEEAYEAGYRPAEDYNIFAHQSEGVGASYTTWGRWWSGGIQSIGYMIPSMLLTYGLGAGAGITSATARAIGTSVFYTGIASGNISDAVATANANGLTYKDLNAGTVIASSVIKSAAQWAVEVALGKLMGFTGLDKLIGIGDDVGKEAIRSISKTGAGAFGKFVGKTAKDAIKEGLEEVFQDLSDKLIDYTFSTAGGVDKTTGDILYKQQENISIESLVDSFVVGALTSAVTSAVSTAKYIPNKNRYVGTDANGKPYQLGVFKSMELAEAFASLNEWNNIINDPNSDIDSKHNAALKLSITMNTVGSVLKSMGNDRAIKANNILVGYLNNKAKNVNLEQVTKGLSSEAHARQLMKVFTETYAEASKYVAPSIKEKIVKAFTKLSDKLKKNNIDKIENVITEKTDVNSPEVQVKTSAGEAIKSLLSKYEVQAVVGVNGEIVSKSDDVLIINNDWLVNGNVSEIVKQTTYTETREIIKEGLTKEQKKLILSEYNKVANTKGTIDDAINALLFDKLFYTKMLLLTEETNNIETLNLLATIDKIIKDAFSKKAIKGSLDIDACKTLFDKIYKNMRAGLMVYATRHSRLDLDSISNEVLPQDLKSELKNNKNILFSTILDNVLSDKISIAKRGENYDRLINKYSNFATKEQLEQLKAKARSTNINDRVDACATLILFNNIDKEYTDKLLYVPTVDVHNNAGAYIQSLEGYFGVSLPELISGDYDATDLTDTAKNMIFEQKYDMSDIVSRMAAVRNVLCNVSNKTLTITDDGQLISILPKEQVLSNKYLTENGYNDFINKLKNKEIKSTKDILAKNVNLPNIKLEYVPFGTLKVKARNILIDGKFTIQISQKADFDSLMHELTHVTQELVGYTDKEYVAGGNIQLFKNLPKETKESLTKYISENFPIMYQIATNKNNDFSYVAYYLLGGELQANSTFSTHMFDIGFKWEKNKSILVSPDGKMKWSMATKKSSEIKSIIDGYNKKVKAEVVSEEAIIEKEDYKITDQNKIKVLDTYKANITPDLTERAKQTIRNSTLYKGTIQKGISKFDNTLGDKKRIVKGVIWTSDNKNVALSYQHRNGELHTIKAKGDNPFVINAEGATWNKLPGNITSDDIARYALDNNYDSIVIYNIIDTGPYVLNIPDKTNRNDAIQPHTDIAIFSNEQLTRLEQPSISEERDIEDTKRYISNKIAMESNAKYFIKKGKPIQLDPGVYDFIVATTKGFDKLPIVLKDKIKSGKLTKFDILDYVATAANIDDTTFKAIAKHVFKNEELAKITFKDMRKLGDDITQLAAAAYMSNNSNTVLTPDEMLAEYKKIWAEVQKEGETSAIGKKWLKSYKQSQNVKVKTDNNWQYVESFANPDTLNTLFFEHYDGTLSSLRDINNIGKYINYKKSSISLGDNFDEANLDKLSSGKIWNWLDKEKLANTIYEYDQNSDISKTLGSIEKVDKINSIESYIRSVIYNKLAKMTKEELAKWNPEKVQRQIELQVDKLYNLSEEELNRRYLISVNNIAERNRKLEDIVKTSEAKPEIKTTKNYKDELRNIGRTITRRIAGLKSMYNLLSPEVKKYIDPKTYKLNAEYRNLSDTELDNLIKAFRQDSKLLKTTTEDIRRAKTQKEQTKARMERLSKENIKLKEELKTTKERLNTEKKTLREKVQVSYTTKIKEQKFNITSNIDSTDTAKKLLNTSWNDTRMSTVQGLTNNKDENVANGKTFFETNAETLINASLPEIENTAKWFMSATMNSVTDTEYKKFQAIKMYFLGYVYGQSAKGKIYENINPNLRQQIENTLKNEATTAGTLLAVWNNIKDVVNPLRAMASAEMIIDGVTLPQEHKDYLFDAIESGDIDVIKSARQKVIEYVESKNPKRKSVLRKAVSVRSMSMLSSPMTWLRNKVSNIILKPLNKFAATIGNKLFKSKSVSGQLKLTAKVTPEIQNYITKNFIDNGLFDTLVANLSKYNPSDIAQRFKNVEGVASKEAIMMQLVIKSMYNEYYNRNMFKHKWLNELHQKLMQAMSDDSYVREAAIRYFGKILAEQNRDLSGTEISDAIMNDFAKSIGLALNDYMHSDNFFNQLEKIISEKSELGWFAYKTIFPFAAASWNWFKAAVKLSPIGLGRAIVNMARLENRIQKAETNWQTGKTEIAPELTEYIARRELGQGVIGTVLWAFGMMLAGFGYISLEEDDYGTPKLRIGNLTIDISSIFGSSSLLAGAALVTGIKDEKSFLEGLNRMVDVTIDAMPLMELVEMDMYSQGGFSMGLDQLESIALSYIPNFISWIAGATYSGTARKNTLWERAIAKIPFLGNLLEKKVDPYTGTEGSWWDAFNRFVPYISIEIASVNEQKTTALGLNKSMLRGSYTINGESFNVSGKDLTAINKAYGEWNAKDLEEFYNNRMRVKVKVGNSYKTLTYSQMDDTQRRYAVQTIMSNNAEFAKVMAWTMNGNKYYASANDYTQLRKKGIRSNVYKGTKGFIKA